MNHEAPKPQVVSTDDLLNGLKHMAIDHPCCGATIQLAADMISEMGSQRDALAEALREMRYGHTDKAERMAVAALEYLHNSKEHPTSES